MIPIKAEKILYRAAKYCSKQALWRELKDPEGYGLAYYSAADILYHLSEIVMTLRNDIEAGKKVLKQQDHRKRYKTKDLQKGLLTQVLVSPSFSIRYKL